MGERKVLNKCYPPDFDPSKLPRVRRPKNQQMKVRMMLPLNIRCNSCGNYIYKGTKFNSRREMLSARFTYLGIQIFRFYFKCTKCSAEMTIKTDPQNSDYVVESGATRNFEPWRAEDAEAEKERWKRESEEMGDAMKSLENRTLDSKREMDILAALDEMKSMKSRHATVSVDSMLEALQRTAAEKEKKIEEEDEALIKSIFQKPREFVRRISDDVFNDDEDLTRLLSGNGETSNDGLKFQNGISLFENISLGSQFDLRQCEVPHDINLCLGERCQKNPTDALTKASLPDDSSSKEKKEEKVDDDTSTGLLSLCQNYDESDDK
ncbi:hypothetical protein E1A91_D02G009600v1 [Gossypium mustelinum]|uniref:Splicing factor YJU2 n=1 Tax=Gossypium mustelinum TaxID=34275 RepID=A0A5D2VRQ2_GOSMU|nr:hypothetical protein E1A91_D02G009600v1 [Gossypium mustelinum]